MTDCFHSLTVVLEQDIREDDAAGLMEAIRHMRRVVSVAGNVSSIDTYVSEQRIRHEIGARLWKVIYPDKS